MTGAVPVEEEQSILLHGEYDGIQELDNNLPPWWMWLFVGTLIFGYGYILYYHTLGWGKLSVEEYAEEMRVADEQVKAYLATQPLLDETNVTAFTDEGHLQNGKLIFDTNCATCHAEDGGGGAGPNLTDKEWLHGCDIASVFKTIKYGVPAKGMIAWQEQLSPIQIQEVAGYILTLRGSTPAKPKAPEGEICGL